MKKRGFRKRFWVSVGLGFILIIFLTVFFYKQDSLYFTKLGRIIEGEPSVSDSSTPSTTEPTPSSPTSTQPSSPSSPTPTPSSSPSPTPTTSSPTTSTTGPSSTTTQPSTTDTTKTTSPTPTTSTPTTSTTEPTPSSTSTSTTDTQPTGTETNQLETYKTVNEKGEETQVTTKTEIENGVKKITEGKEFTDIFGNEFKSVKETKIDEEGNKKIIFEKEIIDSEGNKIYLKKEIDEKGREKIENLIEVENVKIPTKLPIQEKINEDGSLTLKTKLSDENEKDINIMPKDAIKLVFDEIGGKKLEINLEEVDVKGKKEVVYSAETTNPGKLLGLFPITVYLTTSINVESGEIITQQPWWIFWIFGYEESDCGDNICDYSGEFNECPLDCYEEGMILAGGAGGGGDKF